MNLKKYIIIVLVYTEYIKTLIEEDFDAKFYFDAWLEVEIQDN